MRITEWYIKYDPIPVKINGNSNNISICREKNWRNMHQNVDGDYLRIGWSGMKFEISLYVLCLQCFNFISLCIAFGSEGREKGRKEGGKERQCWKHFSIIWPPSLDVVPSHYPRRGFGAELYSWSNVFFSRQRYFLSIACNSSLLPSFICNGSILISACCTCRHLYIKILEVAHCSIWQLILKFTYISFLVRLIKSHIFLF